MIRNSKNEWMAFNREYQPLGYSKVSRSEHFDGDYFFSDLPAYTKYTGLTEDIIREIFEPENICVNNTGEIKQVYFFDPDRTDPSHPSTINRVKKKWDNYFNKIKLLSKYENANVE